MGGATAVNRIEVQALQSFGDGAAAAVADGAIVDFADRGHFGGGAGEEGFVGDVDLVAGNAAFGHSKTQFCGQLDDAAAGDAVQGGGQVGGDEFAIVDQKDVFAAASSNWPQNWVFE